MHAYLLKRKAASSLNVARHSTWRDACCIGLKAPRIATRSASRNSDPEMARFFVKFLRTYFNLKDENIKITCNIFADHVERQREIETFGSRP
jgi:hypothetical protein